MLHFTLDTVLRLHTHTHLYDTRTSTCYYLAMDQVRYLESVNENRIDFWVLIFLCLLVCISVIYTLSVESENFSGTFSSAHVIPSSTSSSPWQQHSCRRTRQRAKLCCFCRWSIVLCLCPVIYTTRKFTRSIIWLQSIRLVDQHQRTIRMTAKNSFSLIFFVFAPLNEIKTMRSAWVVCQVLSQQN